MLTFGYEASSRDAKVDAFEQGGADRWPKVLIGDRSFCIVLAWHDDGVSDVIGASDTFDRGINIGGNKQSSHSNEIVALEAGAQRDAQLSYRWIWKATDHGEKPVKQRSLAMSDYKDKSIESVPYGARLTADLFVDMKERWDSDVSRAFLCAQLENILFDQEKLVDPISDLHG